MGSVRGKRRLHPCVKCLRAWNHGILASSIHGVNSLIFTSSICRVLWIIPIAAAIAGTGFCSFWLYQFNLQQRALTVTRFRASDHIFPDVTLCSLNPIGKRIQNIINKQTNATDTEQMEIVRKRRQLSNKWNCLNIDQTPYVWCHYADTMNFHDAQMECEKMDLGKNESNLPGFDLDRNDILKQRQDFSRFSARMENKTFSEIWLGARFKHGGYRWFRSGKLLPVDGTFDFVSTPEQGQLYDRCAYFNFESHQIMLAKPGECLQKRNFFCVKTPRQNASRDERIEGVNQTERGENLATPIFNVSCSSTDCFCTADQVTTSTNFVYSFFTLRVIADSAAQASQDCQSLGMQLPMLSLSTILIDRAVVCAREHLLNRTAYLCAVKRKDGWYWCNNEKIDPSDLQDLQDDHSPLVMTNEHRITNNVQGIITVCHTILQSDRIHPIPMDSSHQSAIPRRSDNSSIRVHENDQETVKLFDTLMPFAKQIEDLSSPSDILWQCQFAGDGKACRIDDFHVHYEYGSGICYTMAATKLPPMQNGERGALKIYAYVNTSDFTDTVTVLHGGLRTILHAHGSSIFPDKDGYYAAAGYHTAISTSNEQHTLLDSGDCTADGEKKEMYLYKGNYSYEGCLRSCQQYMMRQCDCSDPSLAPRPGVQFCSSEVQLNCTAEARMFFNAQLAKGHGLCHYCKQPCQESHFDNTVLTSHRLANPYYFNQPDLLALQVSVFLRRRVYLAVDEVQILTFEQILSNLGAFLGMFLGMSVISAIEAVFLLCMCCNATESKLLYRFRRHPRFVSDIINNPEIKITDLLQRLTGKETQMRGTNSTASQRASNSTEPAANYQIQPEFNIQIADDQPSGNQESAGNPLQSAIMTELGKDYLRQQFVLRFKHVMRNPERIRNQLEELEREKYPAMAKTSLTYFKRKYRPLNQRVRFNSTRKLSEAAGQLRVLRTLAQK